MGFSGLDMILKTIKGKFWRVSKWGFLKWLFPGLLPPEAHTGVGQRQQGACGDTGHRGNHIGIREHQELNSDLHILSHLWLSKHCCASNGTHYVFRWQWTEAAVQGWSVFSCVCRARLRMWFTVPSAVSLVFCPRGTRALLISAAAPAARTNKKNVFSNLFLIEIWASNKIIVWESVCLLWTCCWSFETRKIWKLQSLGLAKAFQIFL